ncbi:UNVERIFIED_CONTAM: hypothetical protein Sindi_0074000 [Sesamum indicum]
MVESQSGEAERVNSNIISALKIMTDWKELEPDTLKISRDLRKIQKTVQDCGHRQQGLIHSDSFYKESEKEILNLKEALLEMKSLDISEESRLSLENVNRLIQMTFSENPLAW